MDKIRYRATFSQNKKVKHSYGYYIGFFYFFIVLSILFGFSFYQITGKLPVTLVIIGTINTSVAFVLNRFLADNFGIEQIEAAEKIKISKKGRLLNRTILINRNNIKCISQLQPGKLPWYFTRNHKIALRTDKHTIYFGYNLPGHIVNQLISDLGKEIFKHWNVNE